MQTFSLLWLLFLQSHYTQFELHLSLVCTNQCSVSRRAVKKLQISPFATPKFHQPQDVQFGKFFSTFYKTANITLYRLYLLCNYLNSDVESILSHVQVNNN